ncbi:MAG: hypothetical protein LBH19_05695 [Dysgonamonadaceae bacterium]|jgi:hypothetical protein|nr:hypothetical protein [Dysgonamonadaceae bacterium]
MDQHIKIFIAKLENFGINPQIGIDKKPVQRESSDFSNVSNISSGTSLTSRSLPEISETKELATL